MTTPEMANDNPSRGHSGDVTALAYSPDGALLATASWDKTVKLWDATTGEQRATLSGHSQPVSCLAFSPDGKILVSGRP